MTIRLILKGRRQAATDAARAHRLDGAYWQCTYSRPYINGGIPGRTNETVLHATDDNMDRVVRWFSEDPGRAPFPEGTLLHYSTITTTVV